MDIQSTEIPSRGTKAISIPFVDKRGKSVSTFIAARRAFGASSSSPFLVYPLRNPFKEQSESEELERLEKPLESKEEKKQLVVETLPPSSPTVPPSSDQSVKVPVHSQKRESSSSDITEASVAPHSVKKAKLF